MQGYVLLKDNSKIHGDRTLPQEIMYWMYHCLNRDFSDFKAFDLKLTSVYVDMQNPDDGEDEPV